MLLFVYGIISKWYIMVMVSAIIVAYWVLQGLTQAGVLQAAEEVVSKALSDTKSVARYCVPKITRLEDFWECLQRPPKYEATPDEIHLEKTVKTMTKQKTLMQTKILMGLYKERIFYTSRDNLCHPLPTIYL